MSFTAQPLDEFLAGIASDDVAPAGGTAGAVAGAIGTALCEMVCIHSVEYGDDPGVTADLATVGDDLRRRRDHLLRLAETDATIVDELFAGSVSGVDPSARKRAVSVPLSIAETCISVLEGAGTVTNAANPNAVADAVTGVILVDAALRASVYTVRQNLRAVEDREFVTETKPEVAELERRGKELYSTAMEDVDGRG